MNEKEKDLAQLIDSILSNDNKVRQENEAFLNKLIISNPNDFIQSILNLLATHPDPSIRGFCAVLIRKNLSVYSEKSYQNIWNLLTPNLKDLIKTTLFYLLETEVDKSIRHKICDAIGEIASGLIENEENKNEWTEIVPLIMNLIINEKPTLVESGLKILATLFLYSVNAFLPYKEELLKIFAAGIKNENKLLQVATIEALSNFVSNVAAIHVKVFESLVQDLVNACFNLLMKDEILGENILKCIEGIAESEPKFFRHNFNFLFEGMKNIIYNMQITEMGKKKIATETLLAIAERIPKIYRDNQEYVKELIEILFFHMVEIDENVSKAWECPEEGFNADLESDSDYEAVLFGTSSIDKLIASIGEKEVLPILSILVQKMMEKNDWRCKHAGIMALSQVGEYLDQNIEEIQPIINLVLLHLQDPNPKIRYASCHCIGQIANDMKPIFQASFHEQILPLLIGTLSDPVPRVHAHAAAAITNFIEGMNSFLLKPHLTSLMNKLYFLIMNGISLVKENAISALAAAAQSSRENFCYYYENFVSLLFKILENYNGVQYRQLNGVIIECLTLIANAIGPEKSQNFFVRLIETMMFFQKNISEQSDPLKLYLIFGWQRLFLTLKSNLLQYLDDLLPPMMKLLTLSLTQPIDEEKENEINPELSSTVQLIATLVEELGEKLGSNILTLIQLLISVSTNSSYDDDIRRISVRVLPKIIDIFKRTDQKEALSYGNYFVGVLFYSISGEMEPIIIKEFVIAIKDCIGILGNYLNETEISDISKKIVKVIYDSDQRKDIEQQNKIEEIDFEEMEQLKERIDKEEDLQISVAQLIGILFKTHRDHTLKLAEFLYNEVILRVCHPNLSNKIHKLCLVLIDDMIEYLGREVLKEKWVKIAQILISFLNDPCLFVREAAIYGIGLFASQSLEEFSDFCEISIEKLKAAYNINCNSDEKKRIVLHCRDNITASLGKIIKFHGSKIEKSKLEEILHLWICNLPIKYEKFECYSQHELLVDISLNDGQLICQFHNIFEHVIKVFTEIIETRLINENIMRKIEQCLDKWVNGIQKDVFKEIFEKLSQIQQKKLIDHIHLRNFNNL